MLISCLFNMDLKRVDTYEEFEAIFPELDIDTKMKLAEFISIQMPFKSFDKERWRKIERELRRKKREGYENINN